MKVDLRLGDCLEVMKTLPDGSMDAIVTDPPYGLEFMGKDWDQGIRGIPFWIEALRVAKPGAHLLAFGGTRTFHRLACAIEDAGWEIRDTMMWVYGSGFPKSLDVSKAIDKRGGYPQLAREIGVAIKAARESRGLTVGECDRRFCGGTTNWTWFEGRPAGQRAPTPQTFARIIAEWSELAELADMVAEAEREVVGQSAHRSGIANNTDGHYTVGGTEAKHVDITAPATDAAKQWDGWGTALKPSQETVIVAQKPFDKGTELRIIVANLYRLEAQLWLLSNVQTADGTSASNQDGYAEALDIAQWSADVLASTRGDLCARMDMSQFEWATGTTLSTVSSWGSIWEESLRLGSTFIIETLTSPTIDLRTFCSSTSALTPQSIIQAAIGQPGSWWNALPAASILHAAAMKLNGTLEFFAVESAIDAGRISRPDGVDQVVLNRPIIVARKPLVGTVAENVLKYGTGAMNIDECRVQGKLDGDPNRFQKTNGGWKSQPYGNQVVRAEGRWPANLIHDGSDEVVGMFPSPHGAGFERGGGLSKNGGSMFCGNHEGNGTRLGDSGSAARFFYCAKASRSERGNGNNHPTVKPLALMRYLCRLVTPPDGLIFDPFMGSGSTGIGAIQEGFSFIGIEQDQSSYVIACDRIKSEELQMSLPMDVTG